VIVSDYVSHSEICTLHEIQKVIQKWLRHAGDHVNYIKKTKKKYKNIYCPRYVKYIIVFDAKYNN